MYKVRTHVLHAPKLRNERYAPPYVVWGYAGDKLILHCLKSSLIYSYDSYILNFSSGCSLTLFIDEEGRMGGSQA